MSMTRINKLMSFTFAFCLCLLPLKVLAVDSEGWLGSAKIVQIHMQPMGNIYIRLSIPGKDLGCPDGGAGKPDGWLQLDTNATFFKEQYSLLLSAQAQKADVDIYVRGCGYYPYAQNTVIN